MSQDEIPNYINTVWDESIVPTLVEFIKIPNKSPAFDANWKDNGHMDKATHLLETWAKNRPIQGMTVKKHEALGKTPLLLIEVEGQAPETILLYGHLDKQPEMKGWDEDLGPWKPVIKSDKLYGRGGADDGYSMFGSLLAIEALQKADIPHARCVVLIEASEEGGSHDLPYYINELSDQIGAPDLVVCLDSDCGNYEQFWTTTSIRGLTQGVLSIDILTQGVHSGMIGSMAPTVFQVARELLSRVEDSKTGKILVDSLHVDIPKGRIKEAERVANVLGASLWEDFPFGKSAKPLIEDIPLLALNRAWEPCLTVIGADGLPALEKGSNVHQPNLTLRLSFRLPPECDSRKAFYALKVVLEKDPPFGAKVSFTHEVDGNGWNAPVLVPWLAKAIEDASQKNYNKPPVFMGGGGTIPFMGMLGEKFPKAQFLVTGVLGPHSNAHGPNEFLHIPMGKKITACVSEIIKQHYEQLER